MTTDSEKYPGVRFIHLRVIDARPEQVAGKNAGKPASQGGTTVAFKVQGQKVTFASASCHPEHDNYDANQGRVKSAGRLNSPRFARYFYFPGDVKSTQLLRELEARVTEYLNERREDARVPKFDAPVKAVDEQVLEDAAFPAGHADTQPGDWLGC